MHGCAKSGITLKNGDLPKRPEGATKSKMPCTYCPVKKECYAKGGPVGTVDIDLFSVFNK